MNNNNNGSLLVKGSICSIALLTSQIATAADFAVSGFIRQEAAYKLTSDENPYNQHGNEFNGRTVINSLGTPITRNDVEESNDWNMMATRFELDVQARFSDNWDGYLKLRGFVDNNIYDDFGDPNHFEVSFWGDCGTALEICDDDYVIDAPSAYLDYNNGPLWLRIGNQQIAWGEALFFRVADVVNGLDLRRHSTLDLAAEEFSDKRIASPGVRGSYRLSDEWELEGFVQMFSPTIYGNENTPYNVIPSQFVIQQRQFFNDVDDSLNSGFRLQGQLGDLGLQFFAVSRRDPNGVFRWTESNVNVFAGTGDPNLEAIGAVVSQTAFEPNAQGVWTAEEWFDYAAKARLDGAAGLDSSILEFEAAQLLGAFPVVGDPTGTCAALGLPDDRSCAAFELDLFFDPVAGPALGGGLGPLRGHLAREYKYENVLGWGFNYMFFDEPDTLLDQLLVRFEMSFTPDKKFTNPSLSREYIEQDEVAASVVLEKYQRFSQDFAATYMVLQYMFKSESDLAGRHLSGNDNDGIPDGDSNFHAFAFALQQPTNDLEWRFDLSLLYDVEGGIFVQPAARWKPNETFTVEAFANIFDSDGDNDDIIETVEWADEFVLRIGAQF